MAACTKKCGDETTLTAPVLAQIEKLRQWIKTQSNISWLTDDEFLSHFVRMSADDITEAQKRFQGLLTIRKKNAQWFEDLDPVDPKILELFNQGWFVLLPERDDAGRQLYMIRLGLDSKNVDSVAWQRALAVFFDYTFLVDRKCKTGNVAIADFTGATVESFSAVMPLEDLAIWNELHAVHYPSKLASMHYLNNPVAQAAETAKESLASTEADLKEHSNDLEKLYKDVPMRCLPVEYLPAGYKGPNAGTVKQLIEYTKKTLANPEVRDRIRKISDKKWKI